MAGCSIDNQDNQDQKQQLCDPTGCAAASSACDIGFHLVRKCCEPSSRDLRQHGGIGADDDNDDDDSSSLDDSLMGFDDAIGADSLPPSAATSPAARTGNKGSASSMVRGFGMGASFGEKISADDLRCRCKATEDR